MRRPSLTIVAAVVGMVGVALMVVEAIQARRSVILGSSGTAVLFVGLGLVALAAVVITAVAWAEPKKIRSEEISSK